MLNHKNMTNLIGGGNFENSKLANTSYVSAEGRLPLCANANGCRPFCVFVYNWPLLLAADNQLSA